MAMKFSDGKSAREMLLDAPTTVAPVARKLSVMNDPRPPFAPVMKTTLSFMDCADLVRYYVVTKVRDAGTVKVSTHFTVKPEGMGSPVSSNRG
jgi:hypothetical protein